MKVSIYKRLQLAFSKLVFCIGNLADPVSFFKFIYKAKLSSSHRNQLQHASNLEQFSIRFRSGNLLRKIWLRTYAGDVDIFFEVFWKKVYAIKEIGKAHVILDLGANVGMSALFFIKHYPNAKVFAIEPDASNFVLLTKNCQKDIESAKVVAINAAIYSYTTTLYFKKSALAYNTSVVTEKNDNPVPGISINDITTKYQLLKIDILKIDIEDGELALFTDNIEWLSIVDNIIIEIHSTPSKDAFFNAVLKAGFDIVKLQLFDSHANVYWASKKNKPTSSIG